MSDIEVLVFDLGGVICAHDNQVLYDRLASRCAPTFSADRVLEVVADKDWMTGARPITDLHDLLSEAGGYDGDWATFAEDWCCHLAVDPSMLALVEQLAERRRVMIFSNTDAVHWAFNGRASEGRLHALEAHLSFELGLLKPSVEAFGKVAERAGIEPARSLFFDDVPANVEAARKAGFQAEVFVDEATLRRSLDARGILD